MGSMVSMDLTPVVLQTWGITGAVLLPTGTGRCRGKILVVSDQLRFGDELSLW
jgi:hypothetical protein